MIQSCRRRGLRNIGWLSEKFSFPQGAVSDEVLERIWKTLHFPVAVSRGFHKCPFCHCSEEVPQATLVFADTLELGSAEVRIIGGKSTFATPNLIYHYILKHNYLPPPRFIEEMLSGPDPFSEEYVVRLTKLTGVPHRLEWDAVKRGLRGEKLFGLPLG